MCSNCATRNSRTGAVSFGLLWHPFQGKVVWHLMCLHATVKVVDRLTQKPCSWFTHFAQQELVPAKNGLDLRSVLASMCRGVTDSFSFFIEHIRRNAKEQMEKYLIVVVWFWIKRFLWNVSSLWLALPSLCRYFLKLNELWNACPFRPSLICLQCACRQCRPEIWTSFVSHNVGKPKC